MTLQQIRYFLEVAETHKFTAAANNLFVAQSSLSYAIHELEHELGVPLFARNVNKKVVLTEYGETFLPYAKQLFLTLKKGENALKKLKNPLTGTVKFGFCYCFTTSDVPQLLRNFYDDNPNCDINLEFTVDNGMTKIDEEMQLGRYDLLLTTSPEVEGCTGTELTTQTLKVYVSNDHPLASRDSLTIENLANETIIGVTQGGNLDIHIREMFSNHSLKPNFAYCQDWLTQFGYVAMRYGVAISSGMPVYRQYINEIILDDEQATRPLFLHWSKAKKISKATMFVRDYMLENINEIDI